MFDEIYDIISLSWSWRWPVAQGFVTAIDVERDRLRKKARLAVAYEFSIGEDGPYTGESFWRPVFCEERKAGDGRKLIHLRQSVLVRYRPTDPSVNKLDGGIRALFKSIKRRRLTRDK